MQSTVNIRKYNRNCKGFIYKFIFIYKIQILYIHFISPQYNRIAKDLEALFFFVYEQFNYFVSEIN